VAFTFFLSRFMSQLSQLRSRTLVWSLLMIAWVSVPLPVFAGSTGGTAMPWNAPLQSVLSNLTGPTGRTLAALMFVIGGAVWGFTRHEEGAKKFGQAIFGIAVMLGAVQIVSVLAFAGAVIP
jgi:type IV secretory pathway VirB2 component (pilin)